MLAMIGDARVVALGEATHGTHEFLEMKHRILECLVTEKGFTIFAMEAGWSEAYRINAYVQAWSEGLNPAETLPTFMSSGELRGMIEWMRQYNLEERVAQKVSFRGFDMQFGDLIIQDLLAYIASVDPDNESQVRTSLDCFQAHVKNWSADPAAPRYSQAGAAIQTLCRQGLEDVSALFEKNQDMYESRSSPIAFVAAYQLVILLMQNEKLMASTTDEQAIRVRDQFMAENIAWLLEQAGPGAKMVISAHNGHVARANGAGMGKFLADLLGDTLVVIGTGFGQGSFRAIGYSNQRGTALGYSVYRQGAPLPDSQEAFLSHAGLPLFFIDLRPMRDDHELADWFFEARWMTGFGMVYVVDDPSANASKVVLPEAFDLLFFFENTSPSSR